MSSLPPSPEPGIRPYLWPKDLLTIVQTSRLDYRLTQEYLDCASSDLLVHEHNALLDEFKHTLENKYDIVIDAKDLKVTSVKAIDPFFSGQKVSITWEPQTNVAQFLIGPQDGFLAAVPDLDIPIKVENEDSSTVYYVLSGWNEKDRCWVFMPEDALF